MSKGEAEGEEKPKKMFMRYTRKPTEMLRLLSKSKETPRREGEEPAVETMAVPGSDGWGMALRWRPARALPPWAAGASARPTLHSTLHFGAMAAGSSKETVSGPSVCQVLPPRRHTDVRPDVGGGQAAGQGPRLQREVGQPECGGNGRGPALSPRLWKNFWPRGGRQRLWERQREPTLCITHGKPAGQAAGSAKRLFPPRPEGGAPGEQGLRKVKQGSDRWSHLSSGGRPPCPSLRRVWEPRVRQIVDVLYAESRAAPGLGLQRSFHNNDTASLHLIESLRAPPGRVTRTRRIFCQKQRPLLSVCPPAPRPPRGGSWRTRCPLRPLAGQREPPGCLRAWLQLSYLQVQVLAVAEPEGASPAGPLWLPL